MMGIPLRGVGVAGRPLRTLCTAPLGVGAVQLQNYPAVFTPS
jgi:hypothetical protein